MGKINQTFGQFSFGKQIIFPATTLSPMSGVTSSAFRRLCKELAGGRLGLLVSEFIAVEAVTRFVPKAVEQLRFFPEEGPFCVQIYGADLEGMVTGAKMAEDAGAAFVEINAGCPAPKVVRRGGGSGLLKDLSHLGKLVEVVGKNLSIPLSVKVRIGWDEKNINIFNTLSVVESAGADLLVIHGRTRLQGYRGVADWDLIAEAKAQAKIPVVGNGDIRTADEGFERMKQSRVDGISVGRGALHNPWIFGQVADLLEGKELCHPRPEDLPRVVRRYVELLVEDGYHPTRVLGKLKQFGARFLKALPGAKEGRRVLLRSESVDEFFTLLDEVCARAKDFCPGQVLNLNGKEDDSIRDDNQFSK